MKKLRVKTRIEITTTPKGKIYAEVGDVITVKDKWYANFLNMEA